MYARTPKAITVLYSHQFQAISGQGNKHSVTAYKLRWEENNKEKNVFVFFASSKKSEQCPLFLLNCVTMAYPTGPFPILELQDQEIR